VRHLRRLSWIFIFVGALALGAGSAHAGGAKKEEEQGKEEGGHGKKGQPETNFVQLDPFVVPVIRNGQLQRHVTLSLSIEAKDPASRAKVEAAMPRVRDAFARDLHAFLAVVPYDGSGALLQSMTRRLARVAERAVGGGLIKAVLLQGAADRTFS